MDRLLRHFQWYRRWKRGYWVLGPDGWERVSDRSLSYADIAALALKHRTILIGEDWSL